MEPKAIGDLLRIEVSTVAVYILQAIKFEHFRFEEQRARTLVPLAPKWLRDGYENMISSRVKERKDATRESGQRDQH